MIYIGLPVHNEQHTAGLVLWRIRKVLQEEGRGFELVVVDDASTDRTGEVLDPYGRMLPLTLLRNEERRGYAASVERIVRQVLERSGYHRRDALIVLQGDFTDAPEAITEMIRRFDSGADLVVGRPAEARRLPRAVRLGRRGAALLRGRLATPDEIDHPFGAFRLYRLFILERALRELPAYDDPLLRHEGWAANVELLNAVWPHARQADVVDYRLDYSRRYRPSRFNLLREMWELFRVSRKATA